MAVSSSDEPDKGLGHAMVYVLCALVCAGAMCDYSHYSHYSHCYCSCCSYHYYYCYDLVRGAVCACCNF